MRNIPCNNVHPSRDSVLFEELEALEEALSDGPYQIFFQGKWLPVDRGVWEVWPGRCRIKCKPAVGKVY